MKTLSDPPTGLEPSDIGLPAVRAVAAVVGLGPVVEFLVQVVGEPAVRRRDTWLRQLVEAVRDVQHRVEGFSAERLSENDAFVSAVVQATQAASHTHQREKLDALRNAVVNVAAGDLPPPPDEPSTFMHLIDQLTPMHLALLRFFDDPAGVAATAGAQVMGGAVATLIERVFPDLQGRRDRYEPLARDLQQHGLISSDRLHVHMTASGQGSRRTTERGRAFLRFITSPLE